MALTQVSRGLLSTSIDDNGNDTAITIDSSENILVGKTSTATLASDTTAGHTLYNIGIARHVASGSPSLQLTRTSSDGDIAVFTKDGTAVGSIQSRAGAVSTIILDPRTNGAGLTGSTNGLIPVNQAGSTADNHVDLGSSSSRFKDLYLSGAINGGQLSHVVVNTLYDDSVYVLDPPNSIGIVMLAGRNDNYDYIHGIVSYRTSANTYATQMGAGNANVLIGEFSGVPGVSDVTNGVFSVVVSDNGNIYFWNRLGSAVSVSITLLGA